MRRHCAEVWTTIETVYHGLTCGEHLCLYFLVSCGLINEEELILNNEDIINFLENFLEIEQVKQDFVFAYLFIEFLNKHLLDLNISGD